MVLQVIFQKIKTLGLEIHKSISSAENRINEKNYTLSPICALCLRQG